VPVELVMSTNINTGIKGTVVMMMMMMSQTNSNEMK
jgi:hypothetical protein